MKWPYTKRSCRRVGRRAQLEPNSRESMLRTNLDTVVHHRLGPIWASAIATGVPSLLRRTGPDRIVDHR